MCRLISTLTLNQKVLALLRGLMLVGLPTLSSRSAALLEYPRQWQSYEKI